MAKFKIILRGDELDPIEIGYSEGVQLAEDVRKGLVKGLIKVGGQYITAGSIKAILPIKDVRGEKQELEEKRAEEEHDWLRWKAERISLSPKERAQSTSFMDFVSTGLRGRKLNEEEKADVRLAQEKYFEEHPEAHNANPRCYFTQEDLSRAKSQLPDNEKMPVSIKDRFPQYVLDFAERHLTA